MIELLLFGLALLFGAVASGALSLPFIVFGARSARRTPERRKMRALAWAFGAACAAGALLGVAGFVWGASVGDESAGTIAVALFLVGGGGGALLAGIITFAAIVAKTRSDARSAHA